MSKNHISDEFNYGNLPLGSIIEELKFRENSTMDYDIVRRYETISLCQNEKYKIKDKDGNIKEVSVDELVGYVPSNYHLKGLKAKNTTAAIFDYDVSECEEFKKLREEELTYDQRYYLNQGIRVIFVKEAKMAKDRYLYMAFIGFNGFSGTEHLYELGKFGFSSDDELEEVYNRDPDFIFTNMHITKEEYLKIMADEIRNIELTWECE